MRRRLEVDPCLESAADGGRLFVGACTHSADSRGHGRRDCSIRSEPIERIVSVVRLLCGHCAGLDLHDAKSSVLRASESVLWVIGPHAPLFLWRTRLGNADTRARPFAICSQRSLAHLGDEQFSHLLDCSFGAAASVCRKDLRLPRQDWPRRHRSGQGRGSRSIQRSGSRVSRVELERGRA